MKLNRYKPHGAYQIPFCELSGMQYYDGEYLLSGDVVHLNMSTIMSDQL